MNIAVSTLCFLQYGTNLEACSSWLSNNSGLPVWLILKQSVTISFKSPMFSHFPRWLRRKDTQVYGCVYLLYRWSLASWYSMLYTKNTKSNWNLFFTWFFNYYLTIREDFPWKGLAEKAFSLSWLLGPGSAFVYGFVFLYFGASFMWGTGAEFSSAYSW